MRRPSAFFVKAYDHDMVRSRVHAPGPLPWVLVLDRLEPDHNVAQVIRTANAFGCREVHLVDVARFDPLPAAGALRHTHTRSFPALAECLTALRAEGYGLFALHLQGTQPVTTAVFPQKAAFIISRELGRGFDPAAHPDIVELAVPRYGLAEDMDLPFAASFPVFEWLRQHAPLEAAQPLVVRPQRGRRRVSP